MSDYTFKTAPGQPNWTDETPENDYVIEYPLGEASPNAIVARQNYVRTRSDYVRPAVNTTLTLPLASTNYTLYFVNDEGFANPRGPITRWQRVWATLPPNYTDYESYAYTFPGFSSSLLVPGRVPIARQVTSKVQYDFFLTGSGGSYATPDLIPAYAATNYLYAPWTGSAPADYLDNTSTPNITTYKGWVSTDAGSAASYSIEAHDSVLERYMGNIFRRTRRFVKAR